jgi:glycosyltransferase involved in cell wall biosynthesis
MQVLHQGGGAGSVTSTLHLSIGLAGRGFQVVFVCPPDSEVEAGARLAGLEVRPLFLPPRARRKNAAALAQLIREVQPQLVNSQSARDRQALTWLGLTGRLEVPAVFTRRQMPLTFWLENWIASRVATRVIAVSQAVADALARKGTSRSKLVVIHNGLVTDRVDRLVTPGELEQWRKRIGWEPGRCTAGIVARRKDQAVVLRGLAGVETPVHLVLAGVEESGELAAAALEVPHRHRVTFVPFDSDVRPLYDLLDLVLLPSRMEGLSQALLEAMALGKPVAASGATGNLEVVTDGVDGLLVPPLNPAAWAGAITRLATDRAEARRLGDAARKTARERFSLARTVDRTAQLYQELIAAR